MTKNWERKHRMHVLRTRCGPKHDAPHKGWVMTISTCYLLLKFEWNIDCNVNEHCLVKFTITSLYAFHQTLHTKNRGRINVISRKRKLRPFNEIFVTSGAGADENFVRVVVFTFQCFNNFDILMFYKLRLMWSFFINIWQYFSVYMTSSAITNVEVYIYVYI